MTSKTYINWGKLHGLTNVLKDKITDVISPDIIVGISRGGLVPATILSHSLNIPMIPIVWNTRDNAELDVLTAGRIRRLLEDHAPILVVDDICDSGKTFQLLHEYLIRDQDAPQEWIPIRYASLHYRYSCTFPATYAELVQDDSWIVYPYEIDLPTV